MEIRRTKELFLCLLLFVFFNWFYLYPMMKSADDGNGSNSNRGYHHDAIKITTEPKTWDSRSGPSAIPWSFTEAVLKKLQENECPPPILNPFDPKLVQVFRKRSVNCSSQRQKYYFKAKGRMKTKETNSYYIQEILMMEKLPKTMKCCFSNLRFQEQGRYRLIKDEQSKKCKFIKLRRTKVPDDSQFVLIKCWNNVTTELNPSSNSNKSLNSPPPTNSTIYNYTIEFSHSEVLIFFPQPPKYLLRRKARLLQQVKSTRHPKLNVIILGFDQISRMNFIRQMSHSFNYLKSMLKAIDLLGFNKIGDATLNNTLGFLTGNDFGAVIRNRDWWNPNSTYFDKLPWIWKNFSELGYITSIANDFVSVFDFRFKGFKTKPTNYYLHPLIKWLRGRSRYNYTRMNELYPSPHCFGREKKLDLLQNYAKKASGALRNHPYFQFVWNSAVHERPTYASIADNGLVSTLEHFKSNGILNKSLVIILSDHGWRAGSVMNLSQARIENKMPVAFLLFPEWFQETYPKAYENLQESQYRLTTPYDIHSTLEDMLNPEANLNDDVISNQSLNQKRLGISLFRPIPKNRTCESAGIDEVWCACSVYRDIPSNGTEAHKVASFAVDTINSWLKPFNSCSQYALNHVLKAEVKTAHNPKSKDLSGRNTFRIVLTVASIKKRKTPPRFEVVVFTESGWLETSRDFEMETKFMKMSTEVFRLSSYGDAPCMKVYALMKICTCRIDYDYDNTLQ